MDETRRRRCERKRHGGMVTHDQSSCAAARTGTSQVAKRGGRMKPSGAIYLGGVQASDVVNWCAVHV